MKQFESFRLDTSNECLWRDGAQIALPPKPFAILRYLVENPGRLITHDELLDELWPETYVQPQVLRTYMLDLRKILGDDIDAPRFIQTIPKRGYSFVALVTEGMEAKNGVVHAPTVPGGRSVTDPAFIDREEEMRRLQVALESAAAGQHQVVCVSGGAGIGKTALVDAFLRGISSPSVAIAQGQCVEALGRREEYYPLMEALAHLCASPDGDRACRVLARVAPGWLPVAARGLPAAGSGALPASEAAAAPRTVRMPGELCAALEELANEKPLILVFEDLHWADDATLGVISALARRRTPARLMVLSTYRAQDGSGDQALKSLKQDLLMRRLCTELSLGPLHRGAVRQLLSRELGQEQLPPGLEEFIHVRSEGNPLFVKAMLEHLIAERYLVRDEAGGSSAWRQRAPFPTVESGVPDELSQMIELEIERLTPEDQRLLESASLVNVAFPAWAVAAALEEDAAEIDEACDDLARRLYFVRRAGEDELPDGTRSAFFVFAHGLYREVLYQRQSASRRARRHTRIAERLAQLFAGREVNVAQEMAMHYEAAGNWHRAASVLVSAARNARERNAHPEAEALLERAERLAENLGDAQRGAAMDEIRAEMEAGRESVPPPGAPIGPLS
jgi:predicted ATPase/DNA-binding winged helix-turn-helix (wHTH) protein